MLMSGGESAVTINLAIDERGDRLPCFPDIRYNYLPYLSGLSGMVIAHTCPKAIQDSGLTVCEIPM